jgi:hypothetical protein
MAKAKISSKELKEWRIERAKIELYLRVCQFINQFKSKEEPGIKLNKKHKVEILSKIVTEEISKL